LKDGDCEDRILQKLNKGHLDQCRDKAKKREDKIFSDIIVTHTQIQMRSCLWDSLLQKVFLKFTYYYGVSVVRYCGSL